MTRKSVTDLRALWLGVLLLASVLMTGMAAVSPAGAAGSATAERWRPAPTSEPWQWQLQGRIDTSIPAPVYELDGFDTPRATVARLHRQGRKAICYIDVGSWENYRPDAHRFPRSVIGKRYEGFPDERWLDIRRFHRFAAPLKARIALCARKGFDAIEPDNLEGYRNRTGFPLKAQHQLRFNRWIARQAHRRGLSVALKNDGAQAASLARHFDFAVVEQCFQYRECGPYRAFTRAGKAVFVAEYELAPAKFCARAQALKFSAIRKSYDLRARPWRPCPQSATTR